MSPAPDIDPGAGRTAAHHRGRLAFVDAVTRQLVRPPGSLAAEQLDGEPVVRESVIQLLQAAAAAPGTEQFTASVPVLRADAALLSSIFQNLDLFALDDPVGTGMALLVSTALATGDE